VAHDIVVVGGGPGGYAVAFRAAARGLDVALVEADLIGGTCLHRGCIPSKASLHVAEVLDQIHRAEVLGLEVSFTGIDGANLAAFRDEVVGRMHKGVEGLVTQRATLHRGRGRLVAGDGRVGVEVTGPDGEVTRLDGRHVVLATGSVPRPLPGVEVDGEVVQTSDEAIGFTTPPERAVIIGAGAIGMEFASMWRPMGSEVTVVEALDRVLPLEDADSSTTVARAYRRRGIEVLTSAVVQGVARDGGTATVEVEVGGEHRTLTADRLLVAVGRDPNTADTGAAELGILDDRGFAVTDEWGATSVEAVWAVGDVRPTLALAHAAFAEGCAVADRIAGVDHVRPVDHVHTPRVTYCHPEVASVGLTEEQARERFGDAAVAVSNASLKANAKGLLHGLDGMVKVVYARGGAPYGAPGQDGPVLGVHIVGPHATDLVGEATLATAWEAVPAELAAITHAHPTLYEAIGEAFQSAAGVPFHGH
jgi:dihydrolipoamide dehydrogenase